MCADIMDTLQSIWSTTLLFFSTGHFCSSLLNLECMAALQVQDSMMGGLDANVLERLAKIMSYMRPSVAGKPGKRLKRKDKMRILGDVAEPPLASMPVIKPAHANGAVRTSPPLADKYGPLSLQEDWGIPLQDAAGQSCEVSKLSLHRSILHAQVLTS